MLECHAWIGAVVFAASCVSVDEFPCETTADCGTDGVCESNGFCSFPDGECTSGRRFGDRAGSSSGECVAGGAVQTATFSLRTGDHLGGVADTVLKSDDNTPAGSDEQLGCRRGGADYLSLFRFDLTGLPAGAQIQTAQLELIVGAMVGATRRLDIHRVNEQWMAQSANYTNRGPGTPWTNAGAGPPTSRDTATSGTAAVNDTPMELLTFDLDVSMVQDWAEADNNNRGIAMVCGDTGSGESVMVTSSEGQNARRPLLRVTYR